MTKVLIFNPKISLNGITKVIAGYISNFSEDINVDLMSLNNIDTTYLNLDKIKAYEIGKSKNIIKRIYREYKIMKQGKYDVVHVNGDYISRLIECFTAKIAGVKKIIMHSHSSDSISKNKFEILIHNVCKKMFDYFATDYLACSKEAAIHMFSKKIIKLKKYVIINNGIEIEKYKYNEKIRKEIREQYDIKDKFVLGTIGRLNPEKNQIFLINLFNEYHKINNNSCLIIIGSGPQEKNLKNRVKELEINDNVLFLGNREDANKFYNAMDCFILPSFHEGLGNVNIEAQTSGLPTIVSTGIPKKAKISDLITFISLNDNIEKWISSIKKNNDRENAYKLASRYNYDIKDSVLMLEKIYNK